MSITKVTKHTKPAAAHKVDKQLFVESDLKVIMPPGRATQKGPVMFCRRRPKQ